MFWIYPTAIYDALKLLVNISHGIQNLYHMGAHVIQILYSTECDTESFTQGGPFDTLLP